MLINLTSPSQVRNVLQDIGLKPSKVLGQNFLIDKNILDIIIEAAGISAVDKILEIGPGLGVVTERLLNDSSHVVAVEKDKKLFRFLGDRFKGNGKLELIYSDALDVDMEALFRSGTNMVVSNLPYSAGTRILVEISKVSMPPQRIVVTVQNEVAERLAAVPGTKDYSALSVWIQQVYDVKLLKRISPNCFSPRPQIDSMIVTMEKHGGFAMGENEKKMFYKLTKHAFSYRRKQLATVLSRAPGDLEMDAGDCRGLLEDMGKGSKSRPGELSVECWCELAKIMTGRI